MPSSRKLFLFTVFFLILFLITACDVADKGTLTVNSYFDTLDKKCTASDCTLRDAIYVANHSEGFQEIILPGGLYRLNQSTFVANDDSGIYGDLDITGNIRIIGDGVNITEIDGMGRDRVFHVLSGASLELRSMTVFNGNPDFVFPSNVDCGIFGCGEIGPPSDAVHLVDELGGGIIANRGYLKLDQVFITQGQAEKGGGLLNLGNADISNGNISGHTADQGGGIYNNGTIATTNTTIGDYGLNTRPEFPGVNAGGSIPNFAKVGGGLYNGPQGVALLREQTVFRDNESSGDGGAIYNRGIVEMVRVLGDFNTAGRYGGFIYNIGELSMSRDLFIVGYDAFFGLWENKAERGGHIFNGTSGIADIQDTDFRHAEAEWGAAILNLGSLTVRRSFFSENIAEVSGSAIFNGSIRPDGASGQASLINVTILKNSGGANSAAVFAGKGTISLQNVTIALNDVIGIDVVPIGAITLVNTILDSNGNVNCFLSGSLISLGHNIDSGTSCGLNTIGDRVATSAELFEGPNHFLTPSPKIDSIRQLGISPAIDNGDNENCPVRDQIKAVRFFGSGCDIGAIEVQVLVDNSSQLLASTSAPQATAVQPADQVAAQATATQPAPPTITPTLPISATPSDTPTPTSTEPVVVQDPNNASISGFVWNDGNRNGVRDGGELGLLFQNVQLGSGACNSSGLANKGSNLAGHYEFTSLRAGTYCVSVERPEVCNQVTIAMTDTALTVELGIGQSFDLSFGFANKVCAVID